MKTPISIQPGLYRNSLGAELQVTRPADRVLFYLTIGGIWEAHTCWNLGSQTYYLVTPQSLADAGYELVNPDDVKKEN